MRTNKAPIPFADPKNKNIQLQTTLTKSGISEEYYKGRAKREKGFKNNQMKIPQIIKKKELKKKKEEKALKKKLEKKKEKEKKKKLEKKKEKGKKKGSGGR